VFDFVFGDGLDWPLSPTRLPKQVEVKENENERERRASEVKTIPRLIQLRMRSMGKLAWVMLVAVEMLVFWSLKALIYGDEAYDAEGWTNFKWLPGWDIQFAKP